MQYIESLILKSHCDKLFKCDIMLMATRRNMVAYGGQIEKRGYVPAWHITSKQGVSRAYVINNAGCVTNQSIRVEESQCWDDMKSF